MEVEGLTRREVVQGLGVAAVAASIPGSVFSRDPARVREIRVIETVWIPMSDGTKIAARMWLPVDAETNKVPAIIEYIPYRRRDGTRVRDEGKHAYWASRGYACIRPDIRGSGDSEGILADEYVEQEQDDGVEIVRWAASQPWSSGAVGMVGISWGGFSALQVAAHHPPELKAIITHCSTDDRYADDAHYMGGQLIQDNFGWGSGFFTLQGNPPDPQIVGEGRWREMWKSRLEKMECRVADWMRHPRRDAFWKHGSVRENYADIRCAVYAVGGWVDPYSTAIPRLLSGLKGPRKGLIGAWAHNYPNEADPGPGIDYFTESLRWWDHWLKGADTGIMEEPMLRVWMQDKAACCAPGQTPGRWVAEEQWPSPRITPFRYHLNAPGSLESRKGASLALDLAPAQTVGLTGGHWCAFDMATELPKDQRTDDGRSLCFDTPPLTQSLEILGAPVVTVDICVDRPIAMLAVRLTEVYPDGESRRVTYGVLNLTHRDSHEFPTALEPGKRYRIPVKLKDIAHAFSPGNRVRVAISTSYWPMVFPTPQAVRLKLFAADSVLSLPVRPPDPKDARLPSLGLPGPKPAYPVEVLEAPSKDVRLETDMATGLVSLRRSANGGRVRITAVGTERAGGSEDLMTIRDDNPQDSTISTRRWTSWTRPDWHARVETTMQLTFTQTEFLLIAEVTAHEGDRLFFTKKWDHRIPRDLA